MAVHEESPFAREWKRRWRQRPEERGDWRGDEVGGGTNRVGGGHDDDRLQPKCSTAAWAFASLLGARSTLTEEEECRLQ